MPAPKFEVSLRRLTHPITIAFALLIIVGIALSVLVRTQRDDHARVQHSMEVREAVMMTRLSIDDSQNAMRGYVITGRDDYLAPFLDAKELLPLQIENIRRLTADNPMQQKSIARVAELVPPALDMFQKRVDTRRTQGQAAAIAAFDGSSKARIDEAHAVLSAMSEAEARLLLERQTVAERSATFIQILVLVALVAAIAFGLLNALEGSRHRKEILEGHAALQAAHQKLIAETKEREHVELQLRQAQKMEAIGQLTGGVAHDFNNMLAVVIGALDIARKRLAQGNTNIAHLLDNAVEGAKRGATLTQRLLAFSRQQALEPQVVDVNRLVANLSDMIRRSLGEAVRIEVVQGAGLWSVYADAHQLENVIVNLAVNGRDAMPEGGRLTIETSNVDLDAGYSVENGITPGPHVMISVTDTGTGMPPDVLARAFDPFFTTKAVGKGTGLGLSQVFGFVKQSGGHVKIYSEVGQGTSVKIYLRRHDAATAPVQAGEPAREPTRDSVPEKDVAEGHRHAVVLVVEDDNTVRLLTVAGLEELGYTVVEASGAKQALKILEERTDIDLLLTDVVMPEITGRELAEQATKRNPSLKVLYSTGYTRDAIVHNGTLDAGVHLITKPFSLEQLSQAVHRVMGS